MTKLFTSGFSHLILFIGIFIMIVPVWMIFASSTHTSSVINMGGLQMFLGESFYDNYFRVLLYKGGFFKEITALKMFFNSFIMATGVAILSVVTSLMAAYALVYYRIKYASFLFWIIFITILVPLELRIFPTYSVMAELNLVNSYFGLIVPISASAIATLFFRQFYKTVPDELLESAKLDGANTWRFFIDFLIPLSKTMIVAMLIFMFVFGYNPIPLAVISNNLRAILDSGNGIKNDVGFYCSSFCFCDDVYGSTSFNHNFSAKTFY